MQILEITASITVETITRIALDVEGPRILEMALGRINVEKIAERVIQAASGNAESFGAPKISGHSASFET